MICVGRSYKVSFDDKEIYREDSDAGFKKIDGKVSDKILNILRDDNPENVESIDGGPGCIGDSGKFIEAYL